MELRHIIAAHLHLLHKRRSPWSSEHAALDTQWLGSYGELVAFSYLATKGYKLLKRNFAWGSEQDKGEVDLVMRHGDDLVFVEVKTRRSDAFIRPIAAVDKKKRQSMRKGARFWCRLLGRDDIRLRFDVVELIMHAKQYPELTLHVDVFGIHEGVSRPLSLDERLPKVGEE